MNQITLPEVGTPLYLALNDALGDRRMAIARARFSPQMGMDAKRANAWESYGYEPDPQFAHFHRLWERGGLAHGAVARYSSRCWKDDPEVIEGDKEDTKRPKTAWENSFNAFAKGIKLWEKLKEADLRRMVGKYSGLILQIADGKRWNEPVKGRAAKKITKLIPAWEGQLTVNEWDNDETSPTYGDPKSFQFQESAVNGVGVSGFAGRSVVIHPDRVIILGNIIDGVPLLRAAYNDFVNIEKVLGGSGESFLKNASRQIAINFGKEANLLDIAEAHGVKGDELRKVFDQVTAGLNRGIDQTVVTQDATVTPLVANVPDPEEHFNISVKSAAASITMPLMIWIGSQTGERSSQEDQKDWNGTCQSRRVGPLASDIETILAHLTRLGFIAPASTSVVWSDLTEASVGEKLDNADKMATINQKSVATGEFPYSAQEIRDMSGHVNGAPVEVLDEGDDPLVKDAEAA